MSNLPRSRKNLPLLSIHRNLFMLLVAAMSLALPEKLNAQSLRGEEISVTSKSLSASTWNITGNISGTSGTVALVRTKHIPNNALVARYTEEMAATDRMLAAIFGGPGAVAAANSFEPEKLAQQYPLYRGDILADDGRLLRGHLSYAMHLYGSDDGTRETEIYVPLGFTSHSGQPSRTDAVVTFYYPRLGSQTDVTLAVFHIANFELRNEGDRVRVGTIGGPGGSIGSYKHAHLEFYRGNTGLPPLVARVKMRIDPTTVFLSALDSVSTIHDVAFSCAPY
ncbi:MAG: hypothetical protein ABR501_04005 [Pyrinomonadaceae bacterium]